MYKLRYSSGSRKQWTSCLLYSYLMLDAQNGAIMISPIQMGVHLLLSHRQQDINKLSTNLLILETIHFLTSICNKMNIMSNYGVDLSIFKKRHQKIIFGKINIRIPLPPSYVREVWDYRKANVKSIQKAIQTFDWLKAFGTLSVDGKVDILIETLMNIFRNYIPNKKGKCNYCQPPWMNNKIKKKAWEKNQNQLNFFINMVKRKRTRKNHKQNLHITQMRYWKLKMIAY